MKNNLFDRIYTIIFFLFWFGFLIFAAYICVRDENYGMLAYSGLFWIVGIIFAKKKLFPNNTKKSKSGIPAFGLILLIFSWITLIVVGIGLLIQGIVQKEFAFIFMGGFFFFGALAFALGILTIKGYFDKCKIDIFGLYIGILFVAIGGGIIVMIYQQNFGFWIVIPILMMFAGVIQIAKCIKF